MIVVLKIVFQLLFSVIFKENPPTSLQEIKHTYLDRLTPTNGWKPGGHVWDETGVLSLSIFFIEMVESGEYNPDDKLEKECAKFYFTGFIKKELNHFKSKWNIHYIRKSEFSQVYGYPEELCFWENVLYENQKLEFSEEDCVGMKNYVEDYLDDNGDVYANDFDHFAIRWGISPPWIWIQASVYFTI